MIVVLATSLYSIILLGSKNRQSVVEISVISNCCMTPFYCQYVGLGTGHYLSLGGGEDLGLNKVKFS